MPDDEKKDWRSSVKMMNLPTPDAKLDINKNVINKDTETIKNLNIANKKIKNEAVNKFSSAADLQLKDNVSDGVDLTGVKGSYNAKLINKVGTKEDPTSYEGYEVNKDGNIAHYEKGSQGYADVNKDMSLYKQQNKNKIMNDMYTKSIKMFSNNLTRDEDTTKAKGE